MVNKQYKACNLCSGTDVVLLHKQTRDNPDLDVLRCNSCGLVYLSSFEHIQNNFYEESEMHCGEPDIEAILKETEPDDDRRFKYLKNQLNGKRVLDFGCGYGGFYSKAAQVAKTITGIELENKAREFVSVKGLAYKQIEECDGMQFDIITLFHVLEHLEDPISYLKQFTSYLSENGEVIVEIPNADDALLTLYDSKDFAEFTFWSCHLYLYNEITLAKLIDEANYNINWMKQVQRYPLSNHLYWLAKGKPGGHKVWDEIDQCGTTEVYSDRLAEMKKCDTIICSISPK